MNQCRISVILVSMNALCFTVPQVINAGDHQFHVKSEAGDNYTLLSDQDYVRIIDNADLNFVYVPHNVKKTIIYLYKLNPELVRLVDISLLFDSATNVLLYEETAKDMQTIYDYLHKRKCQSSSDDVALSMLEDYLNSLASGDARLVLEAQKVTTKPW